MKYIMLERHGQKIPILFPDELVHATVAKALCATLYLSKAQVVSAGAVNGCVVMSTNGESTTLGVLSDELDAQVINSYQYLHGMADAGLGETVATAVLDAAARSICAATGHACPQLARPSIAQGPG